MNNLEKQSREKIVDQAVKVGQIELESIPNQHGFSSGLIITDSSSGDILPELEERKSSQ
jgi:hypothetical protein